MKIGLYLMRSVIFNILYIAWTALLAVIGLPLLFSRPAVRRYARFWTRSILWLTRMLCGIESEAQGVDRILPGPAIYAVKHQSAWDIFMLNTLLNTPGFVLKRELLGLPLLGWYLRRAGMVAVERKKGASALRHMQRDARQLLESGRPLVIFPEGTRTRPGVASEYHPGVAALYQALHVPVIPVALTSGHCWGRNAFLKQPGIARLRFLAPIPPDMKPRDFMAALKTAIESESEKLLRNEK